MKKGFTLIELLIVITIIGILAVAFLPSLLGAPGKARDTQRIAMVQKIAAVLTNQAISNTLPAGVGCIAGGTGTTLGGTIREVDFGGKIPADPKTGDDFGQAAFCDGYVYIKGDTSSSFNFAVFAGMENSSMGNFARSQPCRPAGCGGGVLFPTATGAGNVNMTDWRTAQGGGDLYAVLIQ